VKVNQEFLPGWLLMLAIAIVAAFVSGLVVVKGGNPLEPAVIAITWASRCATRASCPPRPRPASRPSRPR